MIGTPPLELAKILWPDVYFYDKQQEVIESVWRDDETFVPAGNMLGKDFVAAFIVLAFFLTRHPCRIVTTSAKERHLNVLWGEIGRFVDTASYPLTVDKGGPLIINHQRITRRYNGTVETLSYLEGMVASPDKLATLQGHHIAKTGDGVPRTLVVGDECSSMIDDYYRMFTSWANRMCFIGNTWHCDNFFKYAIDGNPKTRDTGGDLPRPNGHKGYYRKVIQIKAIDSPNVRLALAEKAAGIEPTDTILVPGVKPYSEYQKNLVRWDEIQQCVSLEAEFPKDASTLMFPPDWLKRANKIAGDLDTSKTKRKAKTIGIDPAEGGDSSVWAVVDEKGLIYRLSMKTPDTTVITARTIDLIRKYNVDARNVYFDRGGGGKEHADRLRSQGYRVKTVAFGESVVPEPKYGASLVPQRSEEREEHYAYKNRRSEMYGMLRQLLDPHFNSGGFGIPSEYHELLRQLRPIPLTYDSEGRLELLPKRNTDKDSKKQTLTGIIGCSPDEADALALAVYGLTKKRRRIQLNV